MTNKSPLINSSFQGLGISPQILEILDQLHFKHPTPIQHQVIPIAIKGKDVVGVAQTGTGKTLAFGVPVIQHVLIKNSQALIVLPTRELALQVNEMLQKIGKTMKLKTTVLIGGTGINYQIQSLRLNLNIIIATPGRLVDHLQQRTLKLNNVEIVVIDEADRMFDVGFAPQINKILNYVPKKRQTMLFSATMSKEVMNLATTHLLTPIRIEVAPPGTAPTKVEQEIFIIVKEQKLQLLEKILGDYKGAILVFGRTKHGVKKITSMIRQMGHRAAEIHSNRSLTQRREALSGFKSGKYRVLVATDIAARGIDVIGIEIVINFDLPETADDYVHRIGRTGRAGYNGRAISFVTPDQRKDIRHIERLIRRVVPIKKLPTLPLRRKPLNHTYSNSRDQSRRSYYHGGKRRQWKNLNK